MTNVSSILGQRDGWIGYILLDRQKAFDAVIHWKVIKRQDGLITSGEGNKGCRLQGCGHQWCAVGLSLGPLLFLE